MVQLKVTQVQPDLAPFLICGSPSDKMAKVLQPTGTQEDQKQLPKRDTPGCLLLEPLQPKAMEGHLHQLAELLLHQDARAQRVPKRIVQLKVTQVQPDLAPFLICGSPSPKKAEVLQPTGTQEEKDQLAKMDTPGSLLLAPLYRLLYPGKRAQLMAEVLQPTGTQEEKGQLAKKDTPGSLLLAPLHRLLHQVARAQLVPKRMVQLLHQDDRAQRVPKRMVQLKVTQVPPDLAPFLICGSPSPKKAEVLQPTGTQEEKDQLAKMDTPGSLLLAPLHRLLHQVARAQLVPKRMVQ
ncbi:unnamed protein product [Arctogadus glacialis]